MAAVDRADGIGRKDLKAISRRFLALHRERLRRVENELRPRQQDFFTLLPLLFHINHPMLPGFVSTDTPAGIADYSPGQAVLHAAQQISRSFSYKKRAYPHYHIHAIYLMGSIGSIAHTNRSDFDVWLCHDPKLGSGEVRSLCEKASRVEEWAAKLGLEVHFFVMSSDAFRRGDRDALSHESSGSTQQGLLLEEFYRTGLLLAGRFPIWWLVPPEEESNYSDYVRMLIDKRHVDSGEFLDFGGLESVPADEFFGAACWHLYKGIEAPYKSVLKILLMEAYVRDYPSVRWLCQEAKAAIYAGETDLAKLDPYVLLYRRVETYLQERNERERLELARRCFYIKTAQLLSRKAPSGGDQWRREQLQALIAGWGWDNAKLAALDARNEWKIDRVTEEGNILVRELSRSYRLLSNFARKQASMSRIDPQELGLLGRKLYSSLERRPGKIERINRNISGNLSEERLSLHLAHNIDGNPSWFLYRGEVSEASRKQAKPLKASMGLMEILAWGHVNGVIAAQTLISVYPQNCGVSASELQSLLGVLRSLYPPEGLQEPPLAALTSPPYTLSGAFFVNVGCDPMGHLTKAGKQLATDRCDPLSFGATHTSLVLNLEQLVLTSWGELLVTRCHGKDGMLGSLCDFLGLVHSAQPGAQAPAVSAHGFSSIRSSSIARRVEQLYQDLVAVFGPAGTGSDSRYIFQIDDSFYLVQRRESQFQWLEFGTVDELQAFLGQPLPGFRPVAIDRQALRDTPLPTVFRHNREGVIQLFYRTTQDQTELFVLDEQGGLFHQCIQGAHERYLLVQQQRFIEDLLRRQSLVLDAHLPRLPTPPQYFRLLKDDEGGWRAEARRPPQDQISDDYLELRLVSEGPDLAHDPFTLICSDQEYNSLELGQQLYVTVAEQVLAKRASGQPYPLYLTGVELFGLGLGHGASTIEILQMKKHLENRLNQALVEVAKKKGRRHG